MRTRLVGSVSGWLISASAFFGISAATLLSLLSLASAADPLSYELAIFRVTEGGELIPATEAEPGELVEYQITVQNVSTVTLPPGLVQIRLPIPERTSYVSGSATEGASVLLEFRCSDGHFVATEPDDTVELRWTFMEPVEPGHASMLIYRVHLEPLFARRSPSDSGTRYGEIAAFTQAMFGHLGVVQVRCPPHQQPDDWEVICGQTGQGFERFMGGWDLHADWESRVPHVPAPVTAWRQEPFGYVRTYRLEAHLFMVLYSDGLVVIHY